MLLHQLCDVSCATGTPVTGRRTVWTFQARTCEFYCHHGDIKFLVTFRNLMEVWLSHAGSAPVPSSSLLEWNWSSSAHVRDRGRVRISEYVLHDTAVCLCDVSGLKTIDIACHVMVTNVEMLQHFGCTRASVHSQFARTEL